MAVKERVQKQRKPRRLQHWQLIALYLTIYDIFMVSAAYFLALWLRFDLHMSAIPDFYLEAWLRFAPVYAVICVVLFHWWKLYNSILRFAGFVELGHTLCASAIASLIHVAGITLFQLRMPISYYIFGAIIQFVGLIGVRFSYRFVLLERDRRSKRGKSAPRIMLYGAGEAGQALLKEIRKAPELNGVVVCFMDDNPNKWNRRIEGVPVVGGRDSVLRVVRDYRVDQIYLSIPSASAGKRRDILNICQETGCELKTLPGVYQLVNGEVTVQSVKPVEIEDLLGREPIRLDLREYYEYVQGKTVLVTGGGGSIGSELCRQIAAHEPRCLLIFDIYENNAYMLQLELQRAYPDLPVKVLIGSVRDSRRLDQVFSEYRPDIVYHAAAHKHVPLMEVSPAEAVKNNTIGTYKTAYAAMKNGCARFVLISTDKAVNPTNVMGASKRMCEMVIQTFDHMLREGREAELPVLYTHAEDPFGDMGDAKTFPQTKTEFVAVRFGNVLGSSGSVIPLFEQQIRAGGPVTVTHPDIIRYFMTIPEAVSLVLQASLMGNGSEIFVLDMGDPVKIDTLARNLIRLSGLKPDEDIQIRYTGLRPGEKLYEEKLMAEEGLQMTMNNRIHIGLPIDLDYDSFLRQLVELMKAAYENPSDIRRIVQQIVPTYHPESGGEAAQTAPAQDRTPVGAV